MDTQPSQSQESESQANEATEDQKLLSELVQLQKQHNTDLAVIKKHTGCVYVALIFIAILGTPLFFYIIYMWFSARFG